MFTSFVFHIGIIGKEMQAHCFYEQVFFSWVFVWVSKLLGCKTEYVVYTGKRMKVGCNCPLFMYIKVVTMETQSLLNKLDQL